MVFPLGGPDERRLEIPALVVDTLEQYCGLPQNSMGKCKMQLGKAYAGILPLLQIAQPGDREWGKMTLERVSLSSCGTNRSMWKLLVCKGQQRMETVWISVVRAWGMPMSRISAEAAILLGHAAQPSKWCQVRPCSDTRGGWEKHSSPR
jgi:hypothetical protein